MRKKLLPIFAIFLTLLLLIIGGCDNKEIPVERIAITSLPKLDYLKGETFELDNAMVTVYYSNGRNETFPLTFEMVSEYNPQVVGEHMLSVRYENASTNIKIRISNAPIVRIEPDKGAIPYKTNYIEEQELDISNLKLKVHYETGNPDIVDVTENMVSGYNKNNIGQQNITITYLNRYTTTYTVTVRQKKVSNISIAEIPDKKLYLLNEKIDFESLAGGRLFIAYDNGFSETRNFSDLFQTQEELDAALSYSTAVAKRETVTLNYEGKAVIFSITVLVKKAESFELLNKPSEVQIVGINLNLRGGRVLVTYNNETNETVNMTDEKVSASGYDRNKIGNQTITLSFSDIKEKFQFTIVVFETTPIELEVMRPVIEDGQIIRFSQSTQQEKVFANFYQEGTVDLSLWEYRLKMDNGSYSAIYTIDNNMLEGNTDQLYLENFGSRNFTFKYSRDTLNLTATVNINVLKKELDYITVTPPTNNIFYAREELVLSGATFTAFFNDGSSFTDVVTRDMISGYNNTLLGNQDIIVTYTTEIYGSRMSSFKILVIRKANSIQFESVFKTTYVLGEEFSKDGLVMRIHYEGFGQSDLESEPFGPEWTFKNTVFNQLGEHFVIVEYQAVGLLLTTTIPVTVKNDLVAIELMREESGEYTLETSLPDVVAGLMVDLSGLFLKCTLENGYNMIPLTSNMLDYQRANLIIGSRNVNIFYGGLSITTTINVIEREIESLQMLATPTRIYYKANEDAVLDINNLRMRLRYTNNTSVVLDANTLFQQNIDNLEYRVINEQNNLETITINLNITPLDTTLEAGIEILTKRIDISIDTFTVGFDIIVANRIATQITWNISAEGEDETPQPTINALQGINQLTFPEEYSFKVVYNDGEIIEIINVYTLLEYSYKDVYIDGQLQEVIEVKTSELLAQIQIIGFNFTQSGMQVINLRFQDIYLSTVINVRPKDLKKIEFVGETPLLSVTEGMPLDLRNVKIAITYCHYLGTEYEEVIEPYTIVSLSSGMINYNRFDNTLGTRMVTVTYSYTGNVAITRNLYFNVNVVKKKLINIVMGTIPKTKYIELDQYDYQGGTVVLYYDNNTTAIMSLSEAKRVRDNAQILPTDHFILNYGQFNNEDFSGFSRKQQIYITYKEDDIICTTSYDIIMHDRLYAELVFTDIEEFNEDLQTYYFWYGEEKTIQYQILGYSEHTDTPNIADLAQMDLIAGINYTFKFVNDITGQEYGSWPRTAGTYTIFIHYDADTAVNNDRIHNSFVFNSRKVVINKKNIHLAPNPITKVYGENNPPFTLNVFAVEYRARIGGGYDTIYHTDNVFGYNDDINVLGTIEYSCIDSNSMQVHKTSDVGTYLINILISQNENYNITVETANYVINQRKITIIADPQTKEYGQFDPTFSYTTAAVAGDYQSGLIEGDKFTGTLLRTNPSANRSVGVYTIYEGNLSNINYSIVFVSNTLTITKRDLILTANSYQKVYGASLPAFAVTASSNQYASAFAHEDTLSSLGGNPSFICKDSFGNNVNSSTGVGVYDIIPGGYNSSNYNIIFVNGALTINKRQVNVFAIESDKIYGEVEGSFSYITAALQGNTNSGLYNNDTLTGELVRAIGENAGTYEIQQGTLNNDNNPNYSINYHSALFTINKRNAQIEVTTLTREYNGLLPVIENDDYIVHNAYGDIKGNINIGFDQYVSRNRGTYRVVFTSTDNNHNISFLAPNGYSFVITAKVVTTVFYNIPYGSLADGEYTGSVYKGSAYHYEARVREEDICNGDTVNVTINTAEIISGATPIYIIRNTVTDVGLYSVRAVSLDNNNYSLRVPSASEINEFGDYRETEFKIIPTTIKVFITIPDMSKPYFNGKEIMFDNAIVNVNGVYKTNDYTVLTQLNFAPNIYIYPYFLNNPGQENQTEMFPKNVIFEKDAYGNDLLDEFGNRIIAGYNIRAISRNKNYVVVLTDSSGVPLERDANDEIVNKDYRFKVKPLMLSFGIDIGEVIKDYDSFEPTIDLSKIVVPSIDKEEHLKFRYERIFDPAGYPEYRVPNFMEGIITDKDCGVFQIIPYSTDPNYALMLNENSAKEYIIRRIVLYSFGIDNMIKPYDGLQPSITYHAIRSNEYTGEYVADEKPNLNFELDFGAEQNFYANPTQKYPFSIRFNFPGNMEHNDEYRYYLDYNHKFNSPSMVHFNTDNGFLITKRDVYVSMIDAENITYKKYNGLPGALYYTNQPANEYTDETFRNGYIIENIDGSYQLNNEWEYDMSQIIKNHSGALILFQNITAPGSVDVLIDNLSINPYVSNNFNIAKKPGEQFRFSIVKQEIRFYVEQKQRVYGKELTIEDYVLTLNPLEKSKVVLPTGYGSNTPLFGNGRIEGTNINYIFQLSHFAINIDFTNNGTTYSEKLAPVGSYDIFCSTNYIWDRYILIFDTTSVEQLIIERRELPVRCVIDGYAVRKIYGDSEEHFIFNYVREDIGFGDSGYLIEDEAFINSINFIKPAVNIDFNELNSLGVNSISELNVGFYYNLIQLDDIIKISQGLISYKDAGLNTNYYFTYDYFYNGDTLSYEQPYLSVDKAILDINLKTADNLSYLYAVYGDLPTSDAYKFEFNGLKLGQSGSQVALSNMFDLFLPAVTMQIEGQTVTFAQITIDLDLSNQSLVDVLYVNFNKSVAWDANLQLALAQGITPELIFRGYIQRVATNGITYDFYVEEEVFLKNYTPRYGEFNYTVTKRPIKVEIENLYEGQKGQNAEFDILWDERPEVISKEMILLYLYGKDSVNGYSIEQNGKKNLLEQNYSYSSIVLFVLELEEIIIRKEAPTELSGNGKEYFLRILEIEYEPHEINTKYSQLTANQKETVIMGYDFNFAEEIYETYYNSLTIEQIESAYSQMITESYIEYLYSITNISEYMLLHMFTQQQIVSAAISDEEIIIRLEGKEYFLIALGIPYTPDEINTKFAQLSQQDKDTVIAAYVFNETVYAQAYELLVANEINKAYRVLFDLRPNQDLPVQDVYAILYDMISDIIDLDNRRLLINYIFELDTLVNNDTIGIGQQHAIDISNIALNYNTAYGMSKNISATGINSNNYQFVYVNSKINIYRYVVSVGIQNELPNIMVTSSDEDIQYMVRLNYIDGNHSYINFNSNNNEGDHHYDFSYISSAINKNLLETNQTIKIEYMETFFGYKHYNIVSQNFFVRVKNDVDELLWAKDLPVNGGYTGGTFISTNGNKGIGDKIDSNYTYYATNFNPSTKATLNFDVINAKFRLEPKSNETDYYFDIILNGNVSEQNYLKLRFYVNIATGAENIFLIAAKDGAIEYYNVDKPWNLNLFDGRTHEVTAYVDKLATRESDATGYKILVVIDNGTYFNYTNVSKEHFVPQENSVAGFEANDCYAWIARFNMYTMGLKDSRAIKILPAQDAYYSQTYSIPQSQPTMTLNLNTLVNKFTFHSSSYVHINYEHNYSYSFKLNGSAVGNSVSIGIGYYVLEAEIYYGAKFMDVIYINIAISNNFTYERLYSSGSSSTPSNLSRPVTYRGYIFAGEDNLEMIETGQTTILAENYKNFKYQKTVIDFDVATLNGDYPVTEYNLAFIIKSTNTSLDIRDPNIVNTTGFFGIGIYVRFDGTNFYTRTYIRRESKISYTFERTDIRWNSNRTVIESVFDEAANSIIIYIKNSDGTYIMSYRNGYEFETNDLIDDFPENTLVPLISHTATTSAIIIRNSRLRIYQMESGYRKIAANNYMNYDTKDIIVNTDTNTFAPDSRIFFDNGNGMPMGSSYDTYSITFKGNALPDPYDSDEFEYFRLIVGTNMPDYNYNYHNRGIYVGYKKVKISTGFINVLYFSFFKANRFNATEGSIIKYYREQYIGGTQIVPGIVYEIPDLLDNSEHNITVRICRDELPVVIDQFMSNSPVVSQVSAHRVEIYLNNTFITHGYLPLLNDLSPWRTALSGANSDLAIGIGYDKYFLSDNLYAGLETKNAYLDVKYLNTL